MFEAEVRAALRDLPLGGLRVFQTLGSTNDEALVWASQGAADLSLVVADEQTTGRGRLQRYWITRAGLALAFTLVLRPFEGGRAAPGRLAGLGALAVCEAGAAMGLKPRIKWPNDVLIRGGKVAGILVETAWNGDVQGASVVGVGVNVHQGSAPAGAALAYRATSLQAELGRPVDRIPVLRAIVSALLDWRARLNDEDFIRSWERLLAFRNQEVVLTRDGHAPLAATLRGLESDGSLRLETDGETLVVPMGEIHLRPANDRIG
jgi:BirA family biotin operon repressor/biotin-[acetyl-CoA-carboxylase] ligase